MEISTDLYPAERQQHILAHLNRNGRASVSELSRLFGVSEVTIRTDLQALVAGDLIVRTHGGAVLATRAPELSLTLRRQQQVDAKARIGAAAAGFVADGEAVFLDASSTALALAHALRPAARPDHPDPQPGCGPSHAGRLRRDRGDDRRDPAA